MNDGGLKASNNRAARDTLRRALAAVPSIRRGLERADLTNPGLERAADLAFASKTVDVFLSGLPDEARARLYNARPDLRTRRRDIARKNQINFAWTVRVMRILDQASVEAIVLKGPLRARSVYGHWGTRGAMDVDLLVRHKDYGAAGEALERGGFRPLVRPDSRWWHEVLGESPYRHVSDTGPFIDLHHQIQQPGGPFPRDLEDMFLRADTVDGAGASVRTLSGAHALLVTAIGYGKSVRSGEPWLHYAHEIATCWSCMDEAARRSTREAARAQGLSRLMDDGVRVASELFLLGDDTTGENDVDALVDAALGGQAHRPLFRSRRLWRWLDGNPLVRAGRLVVQVSRLARGDLIRAREQAVKD